mgnify:CR=1 FL=1
MTSLLGITDPGKYIRFSVSPTNFQSMVFNNGNYEFIEPQNNTKTDARPQQGGEPLGLPHY